MPERYDRETSREAINQAEEMSAALFLGKHIEEPCRDLEGNNVRHVYLDAAAAMIKDMKNPRAITFLQELINKYSVD